MKLPRQNKLIGLLAASSCVAMSAACSSGSDSEPTSDPPPGPVCTAEARAGIHVSATDIITGNRVLGVGGQLVGIDGYTETVEPKPVTQWDSDTLAFAIERAGTYTLTLYKERYSDWTRSGIVVERDECHVMTVRLQAEMHPLDVVLTR